MKADKLEITGRQIKSVTYKGMTANLVLSLIKLVVGVFAGSLALIADGLHSVSDLATDIAVLLGVFLASKKADRSHPYGHGRAETFAGVVIALVLIVVGGTMIYYATVSIAKDKVTTPSFAVLAVGIVAIVTKEWLYRITRRIAVKSHSPSLYANAWHHRSDALSSIAVVIGFVALEFGFEHGDQVAAIAVGLMIIWVGVKIIGDALRELTEAAIDTRTIEHIKGIINSIPEIRHWHKLRARTVGREVFLDLHILVDPELSVSAAHEISENLEKTLDEQIIRPINITVHIEPDTPEMRK